MHAEHWKQIEELYEPALAEAPRKRAAFLAAACPDDGQLRAGVEPLPTLMPTPEVLRPVSSSEVARNNRGTSLGRKQSKPSQRVQRCGTLRQLRGGKSLGDVANASTACATARVRGRLKSMPLQQYEAVGDQVFRQARNRNAARCPVSECAQWIPLVPMTILWGKCAVEP
jgi:hypothetical protein